MYGIQFINYLVIKYSRNVMVGRAPILHFDGPGSISCGAINFNLYPSIGCVAFVSCPLLCLADATADSGRPFTVSLSSALVHSLAPSTSVRHRAFAL